ncbi:hypothetical protein [Desulfoplanes sp.]
MIAISTILPECTKELSSTPGISMAECASSSDNVFFAHSGLGQLRLPFF